MSLLTGTTDYSGFHDVDLVVEAVFEDLKSPTAHREAETAKAHRG